MIEATDRRVEPIRRNASGASSPRDGGFTQDMAFRLGETCMIPQSRF